MDCPTCGTPLERTEYEDSTVYQCSQCSGYLVHKRKMVRIRISRDRSSAQLEAEAEHQQQPDNTERVRCPRCRAVKMRKETVRLGDEGDLMLDTCPECEHVWFDGGELARWQMDHEQGMQARDAQSMRERAESRTPEQQAAFRKQLAEMPASPSAVGQAFNDLKILIVLISLAILTVLLWAMGQPLASGAVSLVLAVLLVWRLAVVIHTPFSQQVNLLIAFSIVAVGEIGFLCFLAFN